MLALYDFPRRFTKLEKHATGAIDEINWITGSRLGSDAEATPHGAVVFVRGWALSADGDGPALDVVVRFDGTRVYQARTGIARLDVARELDNAAFASAGFELVIPTGRLQSGRHEIRVSVVDSLKYVYAELDATAAFCIVSETVELPVLPRKHSGSRGSLDEVVDEGRDAVLPILDRAVTVSRGSGIRLRGWACGTEPAEPFSELFAIVDGRDVFRAACSLPRPDVAADVTDLTSDAVGFEVRIPTAGLQSGAHHVAMLGVTASGKALVGTEIGASLYLGDWLPPRVPLDEMTHASFDDIVRVRLKSPEPTEVPLRLKRGDRVFIRGWAVDEPAKGLAAGVVLLVDDRLELRALYGLPRPDVANALGVAAYECCGFTAEIETENLSAGLHQVDCRVLARDGRGAFKTSQRFTFEVGES